MTGMPITPYMCRMPSRASVRATTVYPLPSASSAPAPVANHYTVCNWVHFSQPPDR